MSSKEVSGFTWKCGKNPAKTIYFASHKRNEMPFIVAGIRSHCTMSPWHLWDTTGRVCWRRVEDAHTTPGSAPASQNWSWHWMIPLGSGCWGSSPGPPHSPAHYKISYMTSYLISYYMKHQYLTVLSPKALACQVEWIASCLGPSAASVASCLRPSAASVERTLQVVFHDRIQLPYCPLDAALGGVCAEMHKESQWGLGFYETFMISYMIAYMISYMIAYMTSYMIAYMISYILVWYQLKHLISYMISLISYHYVICKCMISWYHESCMIS